MQGYPILQTDPLIKMYSVGVEMATSVRALARRYLCSTTKCHRFTEEELTEIITERSRIKQEFKYVRLTPYSKLIMILTSGPQDHYHNATSAKHSALSHTHLPSLH